MNKKKVMIAAGGTGGHMFPAQALAQQLKEREFDVRFIGAKLDQNRYFHKDMFSYESICSASFVKKGIGAKIATICSLYKGTIHAIQSIRKYRPNLIVGFGSFHTAPVLIAAIITRTSFMIFDSNAWPGKVSRYFSRFAKKCCTPFPQALKKMGSHSVLVRVPFWDVKKSQKIDREESFLYFGLEKQWPILLVFGGSQGAKVINEEVLKFFQTSKNIQWQVIHLTGNEETVALYQKTYDALGVLSCVKSFETHMGHAWSIADACIARAGAATIAEVIRFQVPTLFIPLPTASENHQVMNAKQMQDLQAAIYIEQKDWILSEGKNQMIRLLSQKQRDRMKQSLQRYHQSLGNQTLLDLTIESISR